MDKSASSSVKKIDYTNDKTSSEIVTGNISKCQEFMRKFWEPRKEKCRAFEVELPCTTIPPKLLPTGSTYDGTWEGPWMTGYGVYTLPNGVKYEGEFIDGMFHGQGDLRYPNGVKIKGLWYKGTLVHRTIMFSNNLQYSEKDWLYCQDADRRYKIEYDNGVQAGGKSYKTADQPTRDLPEDTYDIGDGFMDQKGCVYKETDMATIIRAVSNKEKKWIMKHCRDGLDEPTGPVPGLYGEWLPAKLKVETPPPPAAAETLPEKSVIECLSVFDDEVNISRFLESGSSRSIKSSSNDWFPCMW